MKIKGIVLAVLAMVLLLSGIFSGCGGAKPGTYKPSAAWAQDIALKIKAIQPVDIPGSLAQDEGVKTGGEFDVNGYLPILTHLSLEKGYVLDYLYFVSSSGGTPLLYTRQQKQSPFASFSEYMQAGANVTRPENDVTLAWFSKDKDAQFKYGNQIHIDGSPEGYFEYTVFQLAGGEFYLFAKANQYDIRIVCQTEEVEKILGEIDASDMTPIDESFKTTARALDLQPVVDIGEDSVTVSLMIFTKWGGFCRVHFDISSGYPHAVTNYINDNILKYDSGIKYQ
jgi:hypothetical protein